MITIFFIAIFPSFVLSQDLKMNLKNCVNGQTSCKGIESLSNILVIGGIMIRNDFTDTSEFLDVELANKSCSGPLLPTESMKGFAIPKMTGEPMLCGGYPDYKSCFYLKDGEWIGTDPFLYDVEVPAVVELGYGEYWIVGGYSNKSAYYKNGTFLPGPDLPERFGYTCGLRINETHYFFTGTFDGSNPYIYDSFSGTFTLLDGGGFEFYNSPSCGLINDGQEIVVAGGSDGGICSYSVKILNLATLSWRKGPTLPDRRAYAISLPYKDSFIVIGGGGGNFGDKYNDILFYDAINQDWVQMPGQLENSRSSFAAMFVSETICS